MNESQVFKLGCIILNYNTDDLTQLLAKSLTRYGIVSYIVIIDNNSTDGSFEKLKMLQDSKLTVLQTGYNGGYGYGNNFGINYLKNNTNATHCLIINPDVAISEYNLNILCEGVQATQADIAAGTPLDVNGVHQIAAWNIPSPLLTVLTASSTINRIIMPFVDPGINHIYDQYQDVECVIGCLLLVKLDSFVWYDEKVFLYCEENIIGILAKQNNLKTIIVRDCTYYHMQSQSANKVYPKISAKRRIVLESRLHILRQYMKIGKIEYTCIKYFYKLSMAEAKCIDWLKRIWS